MNLKGMGKKFQEKFQGKVKEDKTPQEIVEEEIIKPTQGEHLTPEERTNQQAKKIIQILQEYPEYKEAIIEKIVEDEKISQVAIDKSAVKAVDSPEVPDKVAAFIAQGASDKATLYVMENSELPTSETIKMANTLDTEKAQEKATCTILRNLYESLEDAGNQGEIEEKIQSILNENTRTDSINRELYKVIAKNFALAYHQYNGGIRFYYMEKIVPLDEMMRAKMPEKIGEEYINLYGDKDKNNYNEEAVINLFLERIARDTSEEAKKQGYTVDLFSPSDLGDLTDEQIETYLDFLRKYNPNLTELARGNMRDRLKEQEQDSYTADQFIATVRELPEGEGNRYLRILSRLSPREMDTLAQCIESGMIETLSKKKPQEREKYFKVINESIEKYNNREHEYEL